MFFVLCFLLAACAGALEHEGKEYWRELERQELKTATELKFNTGVARNVVLFVGDGMGPNTVTSARIYSQGEAGSLTFETFPHIGLLKTYCVDKQVPDSACTATSLFCGVKSNFQTIGVDKRVKSGDCNSSLNPEAHLPSILDWALDAGKGAGFVTTARVTHATPAPLYAHTAERKWECDGTVPNHNCKDIARQLVEDYPGRNLHVIMGGGRQMLKTVNGSTNDPIDTWACRRADGRNLVEEWRNHKMSKKVKFSIAQNTYDLQKMDFHSTQYLLGLFANGHMQYESLRDKTPLGMPSLEMMTLSALNVLLKHKKGFVLVVEGGLIDVAHHSNKALLAIEETLSFEKAINSTINFLDKHNIKNETLVIVTSDHTHTLTISGYPQRGNNILGIAQKSKADGVPYTTLNYATAGKNGFHYDVENDKVVRKNPDPANILLRNYSQQAAILTDEGTHGGGDVIVYATGPMAHLFHSTHEQSFVATVVAYAAKIGAYREVPNTAPSSTSSSVVFICFVSLVVNLRY